MSWRKCATIGCEHNVREGLRRYGTGVDGQELADGRFCWRCRARHNRKDKSVAKVHYKFSVEKGSNKINLCDSRKRDREVEGSIIYKPAARKGKSLKGRVCTMCEAIAKTEGVP